MVKFCKGEQSYSIYIKLIVLVVISISSILQKIYIINMAKIPRQQLLPTGIARVNIFNINFYI
jgi:hypothetical protein